MDVFDLQAKIGINTTEYKKGISEASKSFSEFGSKVKDGAAKLAKISTAALGAAATGVSALVKQSVSAYADYEQLVGGIETLFGDSANKVIANSEKAFATAGMSVNEYMETSIQGAASLINSLGGDTEKAAELMDVSIQDMSDNVNKMGTNMEGVQNAYRGFSRGNFTMLDNLALGFAGTKEGMQELLDKAQELSGVEYDISSYADIVQAIHVVQEEMGITGTTAKEAAGTITGSMASVKAAWKNLTIEMAKADGDVGGAFQILGDNVGAVVDNMLPRVEKALGGVGELITAAAPQITDGIAKLIPRVLPSLVKSAASLTGALAKALVKSAPGLLTATSSMMKELWSNFANADLGIFDWVKDDAIRVVDAVKGVFKNIDFKAVKESFGNIGTAVGGILERVGDSAAWRAENAIGPLMEWLANSSVLDGIAAGLNLIGDAADFLEEPAKAVWDNFLKPLCEVAGGTLDLAAKGLKSIADELDGVEWSGFWEDINNGEFFANWERGWKSMKDSLSENAGAIDEFFNESHFGETWNSFWQDVGGAVFDAKETIATSITTVKQYWTEFSDTWKTGKNEIVDAVDTIKEKYDEFKNMWGIGADTIKDHVIDPFSGVRNVLEGLPKFGDGGRVTRPTLAIVGEKEPETMVPDSKRNEFGNKTIIQKVEIIIQGAGKNSYEIAEEVSKQLADLSVRQQRALGGAGW